MRMLVSVVSQRLIGLVAMGLLARLLSPAGLGAFSFTQSTSQTMWGISRFGVDAGMHTILAKAAFNDKRAVEAILGEGLAIFCFLASAGALLLALFSFPIAHGLFGSSELVLFVYLAAGLYFFQTIAHACYAGLAGLHQFSLYSKIVVFASGVSLFSTVGGALVAGAAGAGVGLILSQAMTALLLFVGLLQALKVANFRLRLRRPSRSASSILLAGLPFYGSGLFLIPADFVLVAAVSRFSGVADLGELRIVLAVMAVVHVIPQAFAGPLVSHLSDREGRLGGNGMSASLAHVRAVWILGLVGAVLLGALWPTAVHLIFGDRYPLALSAGQMALIPFIPALISSVLTSAMLAGARSRALLWIGFSQASVLLAAGWPLVAEFGLPGLFIAQAVAGWIAVLFALFSVTRCAPEVSVRRWVLPLAGSTVLASLVLMGDALVEESFLQRFVLFAGTAICGFTFVLFTALDAAERRRLYQWIVSSISRFAREADR